MTNKTFQTPDLYLASAINTILGIEPEYKVQNSTTFFCYPLTPDIIKTIEFYNSGGQINAFLYAQNIKRLRGLMIMARNSVNDKGRAF